MIELIVEPGPGIDRETFVKKHPPCSIAVDGYVATEPFLHLTPDGPFRNFNHHEVVDRSCTTATCEQAAARCSEDLLDMSSGTFPMPHERDLLGEVRWVFEPYTRSRPRLLAMTGDEMRQVILDVHLRIDQFTVGRVGKVPLDGEYKRIGGDRWWMVEVDKQNARERLVSAGVRGRRGDRQVQRPGTNSTDRPARRFAAATRTGVRGIVGSWTRWCSVRAVDSAS